LALYSSKFIAFAPKKQFKDARLQNSTTFEPFEPNLNKNQAVLESAQIYL